MSEREQWAFTRSSSVSVGTMKGSLGEVAMAQLCGDPGFSIGYAQTPLYTDTRIGWSCPACGVSGTVEATDNVDDGSETIKANHGLVSPHCLNSREIENCPVVENTKR